MLLSLVTQVACTQSISYKDSEPKVYQLSERASKIDSRVKSYPEINFILEDKKGKEKDRQFSIVNTKVKPRGKIVIWLMGRNKELFQRLADDGFHVIGVHYANGWFGKLAKLNPKGDTEYLGRIRLEAATGKDFSEMIDLAYPDGMMERSYQFVKWLAKKNPEANWSYFLDKDTKELNWDNVIVSGISHGSTTAARFAKYKKVSRVVMFSGPRDQDQTWQSLPSATPDNRYFGFTHILDSGWPGNHYPRSWKLLGLEKFGEIVDVDKVKPPYKHSRRLTTNADVKKSSKRAHNASVPGKASVKDAKGNYIYEPVWKYLFTEPVK